MKYIITVKNPGSYQHFDMNNQPRGYPRSADPIERPITADGYTVNGSRKSGYMKFWKKIGATQHRDVYIVSMSSLIDVQIEEEKDTGEL